MKMLGRTLRRWATRNYAYDIDKRTAKRREARTLEEYEEIVYGPHRGRR